MKCDCCGKEFNYYPVKSKLSGKPICFECGLTEALMQMGWLDELDADAKEKEEFVTDLQEECENLAEQNRLLVERITEETE